LRWAYKHWIFGGFGGAAESTRKLLRQLLAATGWGSFKGQMQLELKGGRVYWVAMEHATSTHRGGITQVSSQLRPTGLRVRLDSSPAALLPGNQDPEGAPKLQISGVWHKDESGLPIATKSPATSDEAHQTATSASTPIRSRLSSNQHESHTHLQRVAGRIHVAVGGGGWC
jgi:hypothetical protein